MIKMADDQFAIAKIDQPVKQCDGVASAGNTDEIARIGRKAPEQICFCLNPIHGGAPSKVQSNHERSTNFRQKRKWLASLKARIQTHMSNHTTYALLVHSKEKGRDRLEIAVYVMCVLSAIGAIWQFAWQPAPLPLDAISWESYAPQHVSHHQTGAFWFRKS